MLCRSWLSVVLLPLLAAPLPAQEASPPPIPPASQPAGPLRTRDLSIGQMLSAARQLFQRGDLENATRAAEAILQRDAANIDAKLLLAEIAEEQGDLFTARNYYKQVVEVQPGDFRGNFGLGRTYLAAEYWRQAIFYLEAAERVAQADQLAEVYPTLAYAYKGANELTKASEAAEKAIANDADSYQAHAVLMNVAVALSDYALALEESDKLVALARNEVRTNPGDRAALEQLYQAQNARLNVLSTYHNTFYEKDASGQRTDRVLPGSETQAARLINQIIDLLVMQAEIERTLQYFQMISLAERMVDYQPTNPEYLLQLGLLQIRIKRDQEAAENLQKVLRYDPDNETARQYLQQLGLPPSPDAVNDTP